MRIHHLTDIFASPLIELRSFRLACGFAISSAAQQRRCSASPCWHVNATDSLRFLNLKSWGERFMRRYYIHNEILQHTEVTQTPNNVHGWYSIATGLVFDTQSVVVEPAFFLYKQSLAV